MNDYIGKKAKNDRGRPDSEDSDVEEIIDVGESVMLVDECRQ